MAQASKHTHTRILPSPLADMAMTRDETRSLLTFYNTLPANSMTKCRIAEAGVALLDGFDLDIGPEDRAFLRLTDYRGGNLTMKTFPKAFAD